MQEPISEIVPDEAMLLHIAQQAEARHLHIIVRGDQTRLSPIIPPGWKTLNFNRNYAAESRCAS